MFAFCCAYVNDGPQSCLKSRARRRIVRVTQVRPGDWCGLSFLPFLPCNGGRDRRVMVEPEGSRTQGAKEIGMENKPAQNIQDSFLNTARKERTNITIYLLSGVKLTGRIRSFDKYSVVLETNGQEQLIFKHAISTVVMGRVAPAHVSHTPHPEKAAA